MGANSEAELNRKFIELVKLVNIYLNHFPKHEKYALANRIRNTAYEIYDLISEAQKRYFKKTTLTNLDITHEKLRMQIFLANELGYFEFSDGKQINKSPKEKAAHRYLTINKMIDELGEYFVSVGTETCDANNKVKAVTDNAATGLHIFTSRNGTTRGWKTIGGTFGYNDNLKWRAYYLGN